MNLVVVVVAFGEILFSQILQIPKDFAHFHKFLIYDPDRQFLLQTDRKTEGMSCRQTPG